jgi:hypothetical protein
VRNAENKNTISINGTINNLNNYTDNRGIVDQDGYISDILNIEGVTAGVYHTNSGNSERESVILNTRNKELSGLKDPHNYTNGRLSSKSNVIDRMQNVGVDLTNFTKMGL